MLEQHDALAPHRESAYRPIDDLLILAKKDMPAPHMVQKLIEMVTPPSVRLQQRQLHGPDQFIAEYSTDPDTFELRVARATHRYHTDIVRYRKGREFSDHRTQYPDLRRASAAYEQSPLLITTQEMVRLYPTERNRAVEGIIRLMYLETVTPLESAA